MRKTRSILGILKPIASRDGSYAGTRLVPSHFIAWAQSRKVDIPKALATFCEKEVDPKLGEGKDRTFIAS